MSNDQKTPSVKADGEYRASTGGALKTLEVPGHRTARPIDLPDAINRGLLPETGLSALSERDDEGKPVLYRKFSPERREAFLLHLAETGRIKLSAFRVGVMTKTIEQHRKKDPDFDELCNEAQNLYHETTAALITSQARAGMTDERFDKEGNLLSRRVSYETQIRLAMLKRADPSYIEVKKEEVAITGGAVIVPAPTDSVESWDDVVRRYSGQTIDTSGSEVSADVGVKALEEGRVVKRGGSD